MNNQFLAQLKISLNTYTPIEHSEWQKLSLIFKEKNYEKGQNLIDPNMDKSKIFFVCKGLIRYYYLSEDGKEWNKAFINENTLSSSFTIDFLGDNSPYAVQALEDTAILISDYSQFEELFESNPSIERLGRMFIEKVLISKMKRERSFLSKSAKARYLDFLEHYPSLCKRIPQYHIASYLGIGEASLSRITGTLER